MPSRLVFMCPRGTTSAGTDFSVSLPTERRSSVSRAAYQEPWRLLSVDSELFGEAAPHATMKDVFEAMMPYIARELARGTRLHAITRHFVGAFHAVPGARAFRRHLAEHGVKSGAGIDVLRDAVALVRERQPGSLAA